jgi:hypothetical protein
MRNSVTVSVTVWFFQVQVCRSSSMRSWLTELNLTDHGSTNSILGHGLDERCKFARALDRVIARERVKLIEGKAVEPPG